VNGGPQTEGGERARPADKVVRLPRDWLGPREDLVPFGPRAGGAEPESSLPAPEAPPSAADFWGERSAAIHDAVQAPVDDPIPVVPAVLTGVEAHNRRRVVASRGQRRVLAATALTIAAVAATSPMLGVLGQSGSASHDAGTASLNMATILNDRVPQTLQRGISALDASTRRRQASATARPQPVAARRSAPARLVLRPVHQPGHSQPAAPVISTAAPSVDVAHTTPHAVRTYEPTVVPTRVETGPAPARSRPARSSTASVNPTGEAGALGPVQSPNG
jgi:hypothetical protein